MIPKLFLMIAACNYRSLELFGHLPPCVYVNAAWMDPVKSCFKTDKEITYVRGVPIKLVPTNKSPRPQAWIKL